MTNKVEEIKFRCTVFEKAIIKQKAFQTRRTVSEYCRAQSVSGKIISRPKFSDEEKEFFRTLKNHNTNFTRIANLIKNRDTSLATAINGNLSNMKQLYSKFYPPPRMIAKAKAMSHGRQTINYVLREGKLGTMLA
jgi:hypothetical protein